MITQLSKEIYYTDYHYDLESEFYAIFKKLQMHYGCTYYAFFSEDVNAQSKHVFQSNRKWHNCYVGEKLIDQCPLMVNAKNIIHASTSKMILMPWDTVPVKNTKQKFVNDARNDHELFHGLSICIEINNMKIMSGYACEEKNIHFVENMIMNNSTLKQELTRMWILIDKLSKREKLLQLNAHTLELTDTH